MENAQLINQSSNKQDWTTPPYIIEPARLALGGAIDLDPASSAWSNQYVKAAAYYTEDMRGEGRGWYGRVWLNWPYGRAENPRWADRLIEAYETKEIESACCICFSSTSESWYQRLLDYPHCQLKRRVPFIDPATGQEVRGATRGSTIFYLGSALSLFALAFADLGRIALSDTAITRNPSWAHIMQLVHNHRSKKAKEQHEITYYT